jgi:hypothetical protein
MAGLVSLNLLTKNQCEDMKNYRNIKSFWATINPKKRISKISVLVVSLLATFTVSCDDEKQLLDSDGKHNPSSMKIDGDTDKLYNERSTIQRQFSKSLAKSLKESKMLREIIKKQALEMFNDDYEVLYEMIRDERIENNLTVDELITKNLDDKKALEKIDSEYPTLTILVPSLPNESFNANKWNTDTEIPKVAIRLSTTNDVPIVNSDGSEIILQGKYTPGFPLLVVKESERVISDKHKDFKNLKTKAINSKRGSNFKFLSEDFDRKTKKSKRIAFGTQLPAKLLTAYDIYQNADGWQRDYIYYDISPNQTRGTFKYDFKDGITSFRMSGPSPMAAYNKIADQTGDPNYVTNASTSLPGWTGGFFEFKVTSLVNSRNGTGAEIIKYFGAIPSDLFSLSYGEFTLPFWGRETFYYVRDVYLNTKIFSLPIVNWDLNEYATSIKISIEEVDLTETTVLSETSTVKFASNFGIEGGFLTKLGLKLGGSFETTQTQTYQRTFTEGNDVLGDEIINFADKVIIDQYLYGGGSLNQTREYDFAWCSISFEPIKVQ